MVYFFIAFCIISFFISGIFLILSLLEIEFYRKIKEFKKNQLIFFGSIFFLTIVSILSALVTKTHLFRVSIAQIQTNNLNQIGDFFNGILTPVTSIISIFFLYFAFKQQIKANQLFYTFEIERSFKDDIEWLRSNFSDIRELENDLKNQDKEDIDRYLEGEKIKNIQKVIYFISLFNKMLDKLKDESLLNKGNNLSLRNTENEIFEIMNVFFLNSFKQIFRDLQQHLKNDFDQNEIIFDRSKLSNKYLISFNQFYRKHLIEEKDRLFLSQLDFFEKEFLK